MEYNPGCFVQGGAKDRCRLEAPERGDVFDHGNFDATDTVELQISFGSLARGRHFRRIAASNFLGERFDVAGNLCAG